MRKKVEKKVLYKMRRAEVHLFPPNGDVISTWTSISKTKSGSNRSVTPMATDTPPLLHAK